jgi:D-amino-acid dehydrogenase
MGSDVPMTGDTQSVTSPLATNTLIVGGGIIGVSIASRLLDRDVMILDAGAPTYGTSAGNAGHVVVSHAQPFAAPGMIGMGAKSFLASDGAFAFSTRLPGNTASWVAKFMRSCTNANVEKFTPGILSLLRNSAKLIKSSGVPTTTTPTWEVFTSRKAQERAVAEYEHMTHLGIVATLVTRSEALEREPSLTKKVQAVVELGEDFGLDPLKLWQRLRSTNPDLQFHANQRVTAIARAGNGYRVTTHEGLEITAENIVIAAGSWSREIGKLLGLNIPLLAAKGYSLTVPMDGGANSQYANSLHPMIFADEKTATDPLGDHLRMSARFELTNPNDRTLNEKRVRHLYKRAATVINLPPMPADLAPLSPWTGLRPASADGAPYIGPVTDLPGVYLATGHGMIGTALSLGTGDLIARHLDHQKIEGCELALSPSRM